MAQDIVSALDAIQSGEFDTDADRFAAKEAARRLLARLETPFEKAWTLIGEVPATVASIQVIQDLGIWSRWIEAEKQNPGASKTTDKLHGWSVKHCELSLLRRFLQHLSALWVIQEVAVDTWKPTPFSLALGASETFCGDMIKAGLDHTIPCGTNLPRFLARIGYKEPLDIPSFDNYRDTFGDDFFTYCQKYPKEGASFQGVMAAVTHYKMSWLDVYDTKPLIEEADLSKPLFVDIGGAQGLDTQRLLDRHPDLPADVLIVQDLPEVVTAHSQVTLDSRIRKMGHDFFQAQPIVGARAYFFHAVPHDWPDADVLRMFAKIRNVMTRGYSKLLIYEIVMPAKGPMHMMTTLDLSLMTCTSGLERTEEAWKYLLREGGFKINSISRRPGAVESLIEAEMS